MLNFNKGYLILKQKMDTTKPWWKQPLDQLSYAEYQHQGVTYMVGHRPNAVGATEEFFNSVDGWISVTDRLIPYPSKTNFEWLPWNEGGKPEIEAIYAFIRTLRYWVNDLGFKKIYLHCDGGTHRAVSMFGFYLLTFFPEEAQSIQDNHKLVRREILSAPLEYAQVKIKDFPEIGLFLETFKKYEFEHDMLETILARMPKEQLREYHYARYMDVTLPMVWRGLKNDWHGFIKYSILRRITDFFHKLFKTPRGKVILKFEQDAAKRKAEADVSQKK